jgi:MFS family permease
MNPGIRTGRLAAWLPAAAIFFINGAIYGIWATQVPMAKARLGVDEAAFGQLLLFMGLGALSAMVASGRLIPLFGARRLIALGFVVFLASLFALVFLGSEVPFAVALLFFGASGGFMDVAMNAYAAETEARIGRPVMSSIHGMWSVGGLVSAVLGSLLLPLIPAQGEAIAIGVALLVLFLWTWPRLIAGNPPTAKSGHRGGRLGRWMWFVAMLAFLCFSTEGSVRDWSALYLGGSLAAPLGHAAWGYAAYSACMGAGRITGDWIRHHASDRTIVLASGIVAAIGFALAAATGNYAIAILGFALVGIGLSNIVPIFVSAAGRSVRPAESVSLVVTLGYAGYLVCPPILGAIAAHSSLAVMFLTVGGVSLFIGMAWLVVVPGLSRQQR